MTRMDGIREKVAQGAFEFSQHAVDQMLQRRLSVQEVREAISVAEMIEDYPDDKYGPSCLLLGITQTQRPIHVQCSYPSRPLIKVITVYQPDTNVWIDFKQRRSEL